MWYCSDKSMRGTMDKDFNTVVKWDIPLLEGYAYRFFTNAASPEQELAGGFKAFWNPEMIAALRNTPPAIVVITSWAYRTAIKILLQAKRFGHTIFFRGETNLSHEMMKPFWKIRVRKILLRYLLKDVKAFLCIGTESQLFYEYLGIDSKKLYWTPYAVDNARFQQSAKQSDKLALRQKLGLPLDKFIILYSGKFEAKKRPLDLVEAFAGLKSPDVFLLMVGEGVLRRDIERLAELHQLQHKLLLTGFVNQLAIAEYYAVADLFVMCSDVGETWGLSVNEAMNFSLPVLVSNRCGCQKDLVRSGENGFVFRTGDVEVLRQLFNIVASMENEKIQEMGAKSLQLVNACNFAAIGKGLQKAIAESLA